MKNTKKIAKLETNREKNFVQMKLQFLYIWNRPRTPQDRDINHTGEQTHHFKEKVTVHILRQEVPRT